MGLALPPAAPAQALSTQPVLGLPAQKVAVIGASPGEAAGEAWAQGTLAGLPGATVAGQPVSGGQVLLRYTDGSGSWEIVPLDDSSGSPVAFGWAASEVTRAGGVALIGAPTGTSHQSVVTRVPGGAFSAPSAPGPGLLLNSESLYGSPPVMASSDGNGSVAVFVAPYQESFSSPGILHLEGRAWTREPICDPSSSAGTCGPWNSGQLTALALSSSSPANSWLLARSLSSTGQLLYHLFERTELGGAPVWIDKTPTTWLLGNAPAPLLGERSSLKPGNPLITASGSGVWVDTDLSDPNGSGSSTLFVAPAAPGRIAGTWCYPTADCPGSGSLGAPLPSNTGSFVWSGTTPADPGSRIISGLSRGAVLSLAEGASSFQYEITGGSSDVGTTGGATFGPGGETVTGQPGGAAFSSPTEGWLGVGSNGSGVQALHVTASPAAPAALTSWPVPFRDPLLAVTPAPRSSPGDAGAQALAVGLGGEIARYRPGQGWVPEYIYNSAGVVQTPTLRGVAWPNPERAFAVGDNGSMWVWLSETGLWEPDPAKPLNFHANLTAIAFAPSNPNVGYAVGKQGVLLAYGKTWTQQPLPAADAQANFTSVAFAGGEPIASYRIIDSTGNESGGILHNTGSGWTVDPSAQALLSTLPPTQRIISRVAGLPDGGAVAAGPGVVIERDSASSSWRFSSLPLGESAHGNVSALAAVRDGSSVRALIALDDDPLSNPADSSPSNPWQFTDNPPSPGPGQPPLLIGPDPLPSRGFLLRETASGWTDQQLNDFPNALVSEGAPLDLAGWPDPILALDVSADGRQGWGVGGQTGGPFLQYQGPAGAASVVQTAAVLRYGPGPSPPASDTAPISTPGGQATFALGGGSGCAEATCSDQAEQNLGPDTWLTAAIRRASQIGGVRAFLYAGQRNADATSPDATQRALARYGELLSSAGSFPVYAAAAAADVSPATGGAGGFAQTLGAHVPAGSSPGTAAYAFDSQGGGGTVRVIVLDYSAGSLSEGGSGQLAWLTGQLDGARGAGIPAIVVGADDITDPNAANAAADAGTVQQALLSHGASAYLFYDAKGQNVSRTIGAGAIPAYGSGTLGYVTPPQNYADAQAFLGASGFILVSVDTTKRDPTSNRAPVTAKLIPNAGALALDATDGTLLRRSQVALFQGLARRPVAGAGFTSIAGLEAPDPYTVLPENCVGSACAQFIDPAHSFTSSDPTVGNFVEHDPNSLNPRQVLQDSSGHPIPDPSSGLFCAFNPGTTTATITSGGLSYSLRITVQHGSVQEPCGTVPGRGVTVTTPAIITPTIGIKPGTIVPPITVPGPSHPSSPGPPRPPPPSPAPVRGPLPTFPVAVPTSVLPPQLILPGSAFTVRPLPPIGFGTVPAVAPLPVRVVEEQREEEEAVETQQSFAAYHPDDPSPVLPGLTLLILALAAGAGGTALRMRRRPRGGASFARIEIRRERRW